MFISLTDINQFCRKTALPSRQAPLLDLLSVSGTVSDSPPVSLSGMMLLLAELEKLLENTFLGLASCTWALMVLLLASAFTKLYLLEGSHHLLFKD